MARKSKGNEQADALAKRGLTGSQYSCGTGERKIGENLKLFSIQMEI